MKYNYLHWDIKIRYAEYMTVPDLQFLVKVPDTMPLGVAAMLPTGALWAMNTIIVAKEHINKLIEELNGTGGTILS
jgi:NADPH:quinone reductase-like Zn-dependent oxidoreductase